MEDFQSLGEQVPHVKDPTNTSEVHQNELKRRLSSEALSLDGSLSGHYTFDDMVSILGIEQDITGIRGWLDENREAAMEAIDRLWESTDIKEPRLDVPADIPFHRQQAESTAGREIKKYQNRLAKLFGRLTSVGGYLREINPMPTESGRSYLNLETKILAISIPAIIYISRDQTPEVDEVELLRLYGHEGMGHGVNKVVTDESDLPEFLKRTSYSTSSTVESVAQHYEEVIFEELLHSPDIQKDLGIDHKFGDIYQNHRDTQLIERYKRRLFQYVITVLADKSLGDMNSTNPKERHNAINSRISLISEFAFYPGYAKQIVEEQRQNFDSQGNLNPSLIAELRYASRAAQRVVDTMEKGGFKYDGSDRGRIDELLLTGFWTPDGIVENAKVEASK